MEIFDSHTHINGPEFKDDLFDVIVRAKALDVTSMLLVSYDRLSTEQMLALITQYPTLYGALGCHPESASSYDQEFERFLRQTLAHPKVKAVGEIGLDYHCDVPKKLQRQVFEKQIALAHELNLPLVIHDRDAIADCYEILKGADIQKIGGIMHSFNGDATWAEKFLDLGMELSFSGVVTFGNAKEVKEAALVTPLEHLLVETDAPYLTPQPFRGVINEPAMTRYTLEFLAKQRALEPAKLAQITKQNAERVLKIND